LNVLSSLNKSNNKLTRSSEENHLPNFLKRDNTNWKAGGLEGRVSKWQTWTFGGLHWRQKGGPADCTKRRSGGVRKRAGRAGEKGSPP